LKQIYSGRVVNDDDNSASSANSEGSTKVSTCTKQRDQLIGALDETQKMKLLQLVDDWEEPERQTVDVVSRKGSKLASRVRA
jgi:hypothetical protein